MNDVHLLEVYCLQLAKNKTVFSEMVFFAATYVFQTDWYTV